MVSIMSTKKLPLVARQYVLQATLLAGCNYAAILARCSCCDWLGNRASIYVAEAKMSRTDADQLTWIGARDLPTKARTGNCIR